MNKKILVISDNINLCQEFEKIIFDLNLDVLDWTFSISHFSELSLFTNNLRNKVQIVDLKSANQVEELCNNFDLIFSIHCKQIFPEVLVNKVRCINVHPGYNPINRGWYPQVFAIVNGTKVGATIHEIDAQLDHGNIIAQAYVDIDSYDTSLTLYNKITKRELELLRENLCSIINNTYSATPPSDQGNLFVKKDFNNLCELNLDKQQSIRETLDLLRALTHGHYKNAFYIDQNTDEKVYVKVDFEIKT